MFSTDSIYSSMYEIYLWFTFGITVNVLFDMKLNGIFRTIFNCILLYLYRLPGVSMMVNWSYHFLHNLVMVQQGEITLLTSDIRPYLYILSPTHTL